MAKKEELNYTAAYEELTDIVEQIEGEEISVDDLAEKMKRAAFLIKFCSGKLRYSEDAVERIMSSHLRKVNMAWISAIQTSHQSR